MGAKRECMSWICRTLVAAAVAVSGSPVFAQEASSRLEAEADRVLKLDTVAARSRVDAVFRYSDWLYGKGRLDEALRYEKAGLQVHPWRLDRQLALAKMLTASGEKEAAMEKARLVVAHAEDDALLMKASAMAGKPRSPAEVSDLKAAPAERPVLVLVPLPGCEALIIEDLAKGLSEKLGIPVVLANTAFEMPSPGRDEGRETRDLVRNKLKMMRSDGDVARALRSRDLTAEDLADDAKLETLVTELRALSPDAEITIWAFGGLEAARTAHVQYDAGDLRIRLGRALLPFAANRVAYIGLTHHDLYADDYGFVFGQASVGCGVLSYARFRAAFNDEAPNRKRLMDRLVKQGLASAGHVFSLNRCTSPVCPRAFPISLAEHDAKSTDLCSACKSGFDKAFGRDK